MVPYSSVNTSIFNITLEANFSFFFSTCLAFESANTFSFCSNVDSGLDICVLYVRRSFGTLFNLKKVKLAKVMLFFTVIMRNHKICYIWVVRWKILVIISWVNRSRGCKIRVYGKEKKVSNDEYNVCIKRKLYI